MDNRKVVEAAAQCMKDRDLAGLAEHLHPDIVSRYPQSGEVIRGKENYLAALASYPQGLPEAEVVEQHGGRQEVQVSTSMPFAVPTVTVVGSGDQFIFEGDAGPYPDGTVYKFVSIIKLRDGKIAEETAYFAAPFEAPEWRRAFTSQD